MTGKKRGVPSIEELNRDYQEKLAVAAARQFRNEDLVATWLRDIEPEVVPATIYSWGKCSTHLLEYLTKYKKHLLSLDRLDAQRYAKWVEHGPYKGRQKKTALRAGSVLQHILAGSSRFNYLRDMRGLTLVNPFFPLIRSFKRKRRAELRPDLRALDEHEVGQVLEGAESLDEFLLVLLLFKTGIRREEAAGIRMNQINWKERTISLDPHPRRTHLKAYFDEELEHFLRLKCERNARDFPKNPYLWPSPQGEGNHIYANHFSISMKRVVRRGPLASTVTGRESEVTPHTYRRSFTSVLKRKRPQAPSGCPSHIVAVLRGDSLLSRNELTPDPTQGYYTKFGKIEGIPEVRWWYDRCMPSVAAREIWERSMPTRKSAQSVAGLMRAHRNGAT